MKKLIYIIACGLVSLSCDLNLEPKNAKTFEHFFQSESDLYSLVAQMHGDMRATMAKVTYHEHMGAEVDYVRPGADYNKLRELDKNIITGRSSQQQWKSYYNVLTLADLFMDNYYKVTNISQSSLDFCVGQCQFIRAVNYFTLTRTWGSAVITKGSTYSDKYAKSEAQVVLDTAIYYAKEAYRLLPKYSDMRGINGRVLTSKQYGCKGSAAALLAHMYAWKGTLYKDIKSTELAVEWADKLLNSENIDEVGVYTMAADSKAVCEKTMQRMDPESIFEIEINYFESDYAMFVLGSHMLSYPVKLNSAPEDVLNSTYGMTLSYVNGLYGQEDKRRAEYFYRIDDSSIGNSLGLAYLYKWRYAKNVEAGAGLPAAFKNLDCNKIVFRLADIYLLRAECNAKLGRDGLAITDLNVVRQRAGANIFPDVTKDETASGLKKLIFREREKELLLEGHRYYDVIRNGYVHEELSEAFRSLSQSDIDRGALYLPTPQSAFTNNDKMKQNEYWQSKMVD